MVSFINDSPKNFNDLESRMAFVLELTKKNVVQKTGGPFGAAIFNEETGALVGCGVNRVELEKCSIAHAEMMAFMMAQKVCNSFDLGASELPAHQLVTSSQMCAMCLGATVWSGVRSVVYGSTAEDVESIVGFDEGPIPHDWKNHLESRGIRVYPEIMREQSRKLLALYKEYDGTIYNGRGG